MKSFLSPSLGLATLLAATFASPRAFAQAETESPYLETVSLTFLWNLVDTGISRATLPAGVSPGTGLDPSLYDPSKPLTTETGSLILGEANGANQDFFTSQIAQALIRSKTYLSAEYDEGTGMINYVEQGVRAPYIPHKDALAVDFQLLAIREAPRTIEEFATKPYQIYLSVIDRTSGWWPIVLNENSIPVDPYGPEYAPDIQGDLINTGMTLELGQWSASGTLLEQLSSSDENAVLTGASGKITVAFRLNYGAAYYEDPRHNAEDDAEIHEYHLKRHLWDMSASGHLVFNLASVSSPSGQTSSGEPVLGGGVKVTAASLTGTGWYVNTNSTVEIDKEAIKRIVFSSTAGLAPVRIVMNNFQYQNRNQFAYFPPLPLEALSVPPAAP